MKWPLFENKMKKNLSAHRGEVDIDALWSAIEPEVDAINEGRKRKRRGVLWFWFGSGLLVLSAVAFLFLKNNNTEIITSEKTTIVADVDLNENKKLNSEKNKENDNGDKIEKKAVENNNLNKNKTAANNLDKNKIIAANKNRESKSDLNQKNIADKIGGDLKGVSVDENKNVGIERENQDGYLLNENKEKSSANHSSDFLEKTQKGLSRKSIEKIQMLNASLVKGEYEHLEKINSIFAKRAIKENNKKTINQIEGDLPPLPPAKKNVQYSIAINGGVSCANRSLSGDNDLVALREKYEKQLETSHLGVQFTAEHKSGLNFSTGLQYTRMVELYERNETVVVEDSIFGVAYLAVNPNNDTISVMGQIPHKEITEFERKHFNKYTMFDIPFLVGYSTKNGDWDWGAQAGVFTNLSLKAKGAFLKNELEEEEIKNLFKSKIGLSYYLGGSINYGLNDKVTIGVNPYMRYFSNNFAKDTYGVSQKYMLYGLDLKLISNF